MQTQMNFKNVATIVVFLLIIFVTFGKVSKQLQTFLGSGSNLAQVTSAPATPTGLAVVTGECGGKVNASWNAVSGASYYELVRWPGGVALRSEGVSYTDTTPAVNTRYEYQVRAVNSIGQSPLTAQSVAAFSSNVCPPGTTPSITVSASPTSINTGASSTISWSSTNTTSCTASGAWAGTKATSGILVVRPTVTSTYTMSCIGTYGTTTQSVKITVK